MGESSKAKRTALAQASEDVMVAQTMGGRMHVRWDEAAQATPHGQLVFFAEFLATAGVFERWVEGCPLSYSSPNASAKRDVLDRPWVMDIDATIKPLYGHQQGAEIGYTPHKPGRPSHVLHTFWVGNLRLVLDAVLTSGKQHSSGHTKAHLGRLLDELGDKRPALVRGDCGYGVDAIIDVCEQREQPYLLRLRKTANVKRLIERLFRREDWSRASETSQGWQSIEDSIKLSGWSKARRVVVLRRRIKQDIALTATQAASKSAGNGRQEQLVLALPVDEVQDNAQMWEYTVLVTNAAYDFTAIGQLYRDRCDCENGFDELKNLGHEGAPSWPLGWGGFTTHDMHRSQITARAVALVYNWWSWYVRAANPNARREALTSRPLLLAAVGRAVSHGAQTLLYLTPMHAEVGLIKSMIANVRAAIQHVRRVAEQLPKLDRWATLLAYICHRIVRQTPLPTPPPALAGAG